MVSVFIIKAKAGGRSPSWTVFVLMLFLLMSCVPSALSANRRSPIVKAVEKASPAVVNIRTEKRIQRPRSPFWGDNGSLFEQFFKDFGVPQTTYRTQSLGSGVVFDRQGRILTNAHVIEQASKIYVAFPDGGPEMEAEVLGADTTLDLAVLQLKSPQKVPFLPPAETDDLMIGETVIAIGNPLGLGHSITTGIVSTPRRRLMTGQHHVGYFIQTDALINPGNSGGPLITIQGSLIGINTAIARRAQGIGFAIPIQTAKRVVQDLIDHGRVRRAYLGLRFEEVSRTFRRFHGRNGVLVTAVEAGSPAELAGIEVADVVLSMGDSAVASAVEARSVLTTYTPQHTMRLSLLRGQKRLETTVDLRPFPAGYVQQYCLRVFGFSLAEKEGALIIDQLRPRSPAAKIGLARGDRLLNVQGQRVKDLAGFRQRIIDLIGERPLSFVASRGHRAYRFSLP